MEDIILKCERIEKKYSKTKALDNKDLSLEYQYRHEGVSDYITSPVNIPELIRRICYFVEE